MYVSVCKVMYVSVCKHVCTGERMLACVYVGVSVSVEILVGWGGGGEGHYMGACVYMSAEACM